MLRSGLLIGVIFLAGPAAAQEAPPTLPPVSRPAAPPDGGERPPAKPAELPQPEANAPSGGPASSTPISEPAELAVEAVPADVPDPDPQSAVPAGPPAWQALAEDEFTYQSCLLGLMMLGVSYAPLDPITSPEDRDCGIARPLNITEIQPGVTIASGATMRCDTARRLALWFRNDAAPAARHLPGAPRITEILPGSTYQCRARVGGSDDKLSEHALGNAFDVSGLRFSDGSEMLITPRDDTGDMTEAFQKALRYSACLYFTTVLGPGSNAAHDDHLHFDIAARKGGWRLCE